MPGLDGAPEVVQVSSSHQGPVSGLSGEFSQKHKAEHMLSKRDWLCGSNTAGLCFLGKLRGGGSDTHTAPLSSKAWMYRSTFILPVICQVLPHKLLEEHRGRSEVAQS